MCSRATTGTNGSFSGGPTCWVQATERKLNEQIKTGGRLEARQTPERQHPRWGRSLSVSVLQQKKAANFSSLPSAGSLRRGLARHRRSRRPSDHLCLKKQGFLPTSPALALSLHPPQNCFLAFWKQVCLLHLQ